VSGSGRQPRVKGTASRPCVFVVGERDEIAKELGLATLPGPVGNPLKDIDRAVEALEACRRSKVVIKGGTPYEILIAATAAYMQYRKTELIVLHNPRAVAIESAILHSLGTGQTYRIRKTILQLTNNCTPIETIADLLGQTPKTIERHAKLMKKAKLITINKNKICKQQ